MNETCLHCGQPVHPNEQKLWRWAGWAVYGPAPSAPAPVREGKRGEKDQWDWLFHKDCFVEWLENRNGAMQDLDRPVNNCRFFERTGTSIHGYYVREGKKHPCLAAWLEADIFNTSIFPTTVGEARLDFEFVSVVVKDNSAFLEAFRVFLKKNGWYNAGWYVPRKEFALKEEIANRRKNGH